MSIEPHTLGTWLIFVSFANCLVGSLRHGLSNSKAARIAGDVFIGGLIEIHDAGGKSVVNCSELDFDSDGFQRLEAMLFAVKRVNADPAILPDTRLGVVIRDSCGSETKALDESLQFVMNTVPACESGSNSTEEQLAGMHGVIGTGLSVVTAPVASLLRLFQIPQISYGATSIELDDRSKYDFLLRTVPADSFQVQAIAEFIVHELKWDAVYGISSTGSYGERGMEAFTKVAEAAGISVVENVRVSPLMSRAEMRDALERLYLQDRRVTGLVLICAKPDLQQILAILQEDQKFVRHFHLIGSDAWASSLFPGSSVWFAFHYNRSNLADFYDYYSRRRPLADVADENPWLHKFWKDQCALAQTALPDRDLYCSDYNRSSFAFCKEEFSLATCSSDDKIPYVIDAVYAFAYALDAMVKLECTNQNRAECLRRSDGTKFLERYLKRLNFTGVSGVVNFSEKVKRGRYDINVFRENGSISRIGTWDCGDLRMTSGWKSNFGRSTCKDECQVGYRRLPREPLRSCWSCTACKPGEFLKDNFTCEACPPGYKPHPLFNFTTCYELEIRHLSLPWLAVTVLLASSGVLLTFSVLSSFIKNNDTPLIKASGRELSYMLLGGIMLLYGLPFLLAVQPRPLPCGMARFGIGFLMCVCYSALLIRTNRIARIFSGRPDLIFISPRWQVMLTAFFVLPQVLIGVVGLVHVPPAAVLSFENENFTVVKCNTESKDLMASLAYNLLLVVMSAVYAFRTRKVPNNFNEARYIGFVMYTTLVIWIAFLPVFFSASSEYQTVAMLLVLIINATTLLVGMFGMKMYIIVFRPDKNSRTNSKMRSITLSYFSEGDGTVVMGEKPSWHTTPCGKRAVSPVAPVTPVTPATTVLALIKYVERSDRSTAEAKGLTHRQGDLADGRLPYLP